MIFKTVFVLSVFVLVVQVTSGPVMPRPSAPFDVAKKFQGPCVLQGGVCVSIKACTPGELVQYKADLCPMQEDLQCCYKPLSKMLATKDTR